MGHVTREGLYNNNNNYYYYYYYYYCKNSMQNDCFQMNEN